MKVNIDLTEEEVKVLKRILGRIDYKMTREEEVSAMFTEAEESFGQIDVEEEEEEPLTTGQRKGLMAIIRSKECDDVFLSGKSVVAKGFYDKNHKLRSAVFDTMKDVEEVLGLKVVGILREHG